MSLVTIENAGIARLTVMNPPLNILTCGVMEELTAQLRAVQPDDRAVVIRGEGKHFSAGADIGEHLPGAGRDLLGTLQALFSTLHDLRVPTVAVVRGACMGAGLELAAACDFMLVAEDAKLGVPEINLGVIAPIAAVDLPRKIGPARAAEMLFLGRTITGREAADWGLANECVPAAELDARADSLLAKLASLSATALRSCKRAIRAAAARPIACDALAAALGVYREEVLPSEDGLEGLKAFLEKRKPSWVNR